MKGTNANDNIEGQRHMMAARDNDERQTTATKNSNDDEGWRRMTAAQDGGAWQQQATKKRNKW